ncbi:MAG: HAD-IA family hydrolase [bacterium]|nr:HAD-IA family hydrolase [bacterium]
MKVIIFDFWGVIFDPISNEPFIGLEDFLRDAEERNLVCGIASSSSREFVLDFLKEHELDSYFEKIVGMNDVANLKPDPECFIKVAEYFGVEPEECLVIDDSTMTIDAAREEGFECISFGNDVSEFDDIDLYSLLS